MEDLTLFCSLDPKDSITVNFSQTQPNQELLVLAFDDSVHFAVALNEKSIKTLYLKLGIYLALKAQNRGE